MVGTGEVELRVRRERLKEIVLGRRDETVFLGRFELLELIGAGGMGSVYAARDPQLDRTVAIKVLDEDLPADRLHEEARTLARLSHPNVVPVHEIGWHEGRAFVVMERIEGESLAQWLHREQRPWPEVLEVFVAAGRGLAAAHAVEVVHRDFKPDNALIDTEGHVRVVDFGLARSFNASASQAGGRVWLSVAGTPLFMAPEVVAGQPADVRSDQYSLCFAAHDALFGDDAAVVSAPPRRIRQALERGMARVPAQRWASLDALLGALDRDRTGARRPWGWLLGAVSVAAVAVAVSPRSEVDPCEQSARAVEEIWPGSIRAAVVGHEGDSDVPSTAEALDAYADRWSSTRRSVCRAQAGVHAEVCLDSRLRTFTRVAEGLAATGLSPERQLRAVLSLPGVEDCAVEMTVPEQSVDAEIELALAEAIAVGIIGHAYDAVDDFEAVTQRARASGHRLSLTHALLEQSALLGFLGRWEQPEILLAESFWIALEDGSNAEAARAASALAFLHAAVLRQHEQGMMWGRLAETTARRPGVPASVHADAIIKRALANHHADELVPAVAILDRALAVFAQIPQPSPLMVVEFADLRSQVLRSVGRGEEALPQLVSALDFAREVFGPHHPNLAHVVSSYGAVLYDVGRYSEAVAAYRQALEIYRLKHHARWVADTQSRLAQSLRGAGRVAEALALARQGLESTLEIHGEEDQTVAWCRTVLAEVLLDQDQPQEARRQLERALLRYELNLGEDHRELLEVLYPLALTYRRLGDEQAARSVFERAMTLADVLPQPARTTAIGRLERGMATAG
ncbi:MAG: serine/threonine-protein kinase [Deltaproteobacteria bacterium]|nr:serine/threonine-protein kinase [Deltaproteobacteria bacterium]